MTFHCIPDMMPTSNTMFNSRKRDIVDKSYAGLNHCRIVDSFIKASIAGTLETRKHIELSPEYDLVSTKSRKYTYSYDIVVINRNTKDIVILLQYGMIFLFDCPDDIWLLFQAVLQATVEDCNFTYARLSKEYVESKRFCISKLDNSEIANYIVQTLTKDGVLKLA
jgi:hypothetical protein